jgi:capsid protein
MYGKPGQDVKFNQPAPVGGYREYLMTELQGIGAGVDVPYELLSNDLSNVNYSSYRAGMLSFRNTIEAFRWLVLIPQTCNPVWRRFIDVLVIQGKIAKPNYGVQWTAPKFQTVDPAKDAQAVKTRIRIGTTTWPEAVAEEGQDPESQLGEIVSWNKRFDAGNVVLDCDPRWVNDKGLAQNVNSTEEAAGGKKAAAKVTNSALITDIGAELVKIQTEVFRDLPNQRTYLHR